jgi:hypothetical protein
MSTKLITPMSIIGAGVAVKLMKALDKADKAPERGLAAFVEDGRFRAQAWRTRGGAVAARVWLTGVSYEHHLYRGRYEWRGYVRAARPVDSINRAATALWLKEKDDAPLFAAREAVYQLAERKEIDPDTLPNIERTQEYAEMSLEDCAFWTEWLNRQPNMTATETTP